MPDILDLYMIVGDPQIAGFVATRGVTRLFVDLEYMGKDLRQKGDTWKSKHTLDDVADVRAVISDAHMMVRVNPLHDGSKTEVDAVLARGADSIMLPMFRSHDDLARFWDIVNGRAEVVPLVETGAALAAVPELLERLPLTRLHIGLNDLHLDMGHSFMFEPIADGTLETACHALRGAGVPFGIGGIARVGEGGISPEYLLGEHVRLGSSAAILSRTFHRGSGTLAALQYEMDFADEVAKLNTLYASCMQMDAVALEANRITTATRINALAKQIRAARDNQIQGA